ncbi:hypothetical protein ABZ805_14090 [Saccharopolyspora sp. NPDC047091]|uniref:hypothetical protein n=1 Tax=Saccharopolyspora sp. NPDC047091 TaxID=3155924 RepID=UPI003410D607
MSQVPDTTRFAEAAVRHYRDAELLLGRQRVANADHLAGIAAECALKAILIGHLGGVLHGDRPKHPAEPKATYGHLPGLWHELSLLPAGRTGGAFHQAISAANPFEHWTVFERYSDGAHIDAARADAHLAEARKLLSFHQQAQINGVLP